MEEQQVERREDFAASRPALSVVIPAFNEERRLPRTLEAIEAFLQRQVDLTCEVLVVDNASTDRTVDVVQTFAVDRPWLRLVQLSRRGKGYAVRAGVHAARGGVVLFADADQSWPLEELRCFVELTNAETAVVIGSREGEQARRVGEPVHRHVMGRVFNRLVQQLAVPGIEDTQCGFKAFRADAARNIFRRQLLDGFAFDVEVLYLARQLGYRIVERPIHWEHQADSRVQPGRDAVLMLLEVLAIRWHSVTGGYRRAAGTRVGAWGTEPASGHVGVG